MSQFRNGKMLYPILGAGFFLILTYLIIVDYHWFNYLDTYIYQFSWTPRNSFAAFINLFAKTATIVPILVISLIISLLLWFKGYKWLAVWNVVNVLGVSVLGFILKQLVARTRPNVNQLFERSSYSFPSGHSLLAMCLIGSILYILKSINFPSHTTPLIICLIFYLLFIGFSRVFLRVHYPSDVIGGYLLSYVWLSVSFLFFQKKISVEGNT